MKKNAEEEVVVVTITKEEGVAAEEATKAPKARRTRTKAPKTPEGATEDAPKDDTVHPISEENEEEILKTAQELLGGAKATSADEAKKFCNILEEIAKQLDGRRTEKTAETSAYDFGDSLDDEDELDEDYFEEDEDDVLGLPMSRKTKIAIVSMIVVSTISAIIAVAALFKKK